MGLASGQRRRQGDEEARMVDIWRSHAVLHRIRAGVDFEDFEDFEDFQARIRVRIRT